MSRMLVFSYGTLQKKDIQLAQFGRELQGRPDTLPGYTRQPVSVTDSRVATLTGEAVNFTAVPGEDSIEGTVFELTEQEFAAADAYEEAADYERVQVTLKSGRQAWLYVHRNRGQDAGVAR